MIPDHFTCYRVADPLPAGAALVPRGSPGTATAAELPAGEVTIRVEFSSLNYKDALAACGHPGIVRTFPHVPGIDAAGTVLVSSSPCFAPGMPVLVTGFELGSGQWGGWSEFTRVRSDWVIPLPAGLTSRDAMTLGTAGFTAAQSVMALQRSGIEPSSGPVIVTGGTGGVGSLAIMLLAHLGYTVETVTAKTEHARWLHELGASVVHPRDVLADNSPKPLLPARWAGAVDTVGGPMLATLLKSIRHRGCVATCGMVGGVDLHTSVYPFILRGVKLDGIDSAQCPLGPRHEIWRRLADEWRLSGLERVSHEVPLTSLTAAVTEVLAGKGVGRTVVRLARSGTNPTSGESSAGPHQLSE